jgi:mRNA interferase MazF
MQKQRPAVIVSNDSANKFLNRVQVVPLSSKVGKVFPSETRVKFKGKQGKALADQVTTVSKLRLISYGGTVTTAELEEIEAAIKVQLQLS